MELVRQLRRRLPQCGGVNLWRLVNRMLRILKLRCVGRDRVAKIVRENGLKVRRVKSSQVQTTYSNHSYAVQPNIYRDLNITGPNQALVADITYVPIRNSKAYLFLITDAFSRMIVGYHLSSSLSHEGAICALNMALEVIPNPKGIIHHTDRGVQYCCHDFLDAISKWEMKSSMTDADHCAQNALAERMNGILKQEFIFYSPFPTFNDARRAIEDSVFNYNHLRVHGQLKSKTPAEVHFGQDLALELWAKELVSFSLPQPPDFLTV